MVVLDGGNSDISPFFCVLLLLDEGTIEKNIKNKSIMKKLILLFALITALLSGCKKDISPVVTSISLDKTTISIPLGGQTQLNISYLPSDLPTPTYKWTSSDEAIATVDSNGNVAAIKLGTASVTVETMEIKASCKITVTPILATSIALNKKQLTLFITEDEVLTYTLLPENTTDKTIEWNSSDSAVATVDNSGKVKAVGVGSAKITVTSANDISDVCDVVVNPVQAQGITLNNSDLTLEMTDTELLSVVFNPANTTNKHIAWSSSDNSTATISSEGLVTGIKEGQAVITAKSEDGNFTATCNVTVKLKGIELTKNGWQTLPNQRELIHVKYSTTGNAYIEARWSSSNPSVATIAGDGEGTNSAEIVTKATGIAVITATSADGSKTATCVVTVKEITDYVSLIAQPTSISTVNGGVAYTIHCKFTNPINTRVGIQSVWLTDSSNTVLQIEAPGMPSVTNSSLITIFSPYILYTDWSSAQRITSSYKAAVQYTCNGKSYLIFTNIDATTIGGF